MCNVEFIYKDMLPKETKSGRLGYYPVTNYQEWDELPDLYKTMEWEPVTDPSDKNNTSAVKAVIFDVPYMEPMEYGQKYLYILQKCKKYYFVRLKNLNAYFILSVW